MPLYSFQCFECGCRFEKAVSVENASENSPCISCKEPAERVVEEVSFSFDNDSTHEGLSLQNTGVSSVDYDWDEIVARDSEKKWEQIEGRQNLKRHVLRGTSHSNLDLLKSPDGEYDLMTPEEADCSWRVRDLNSSAMKWLDSKKKKVS